MKNIALLHRTATVYEEYGVVTGCQQGFYRITTASGNYFAKRSFSCLVEPEKDDRVLVCIQPDDSVYILAVLERCKNKSCCLSIDGDITLRSQSGSLFFEAKTDMQLNSKDSIKMSSQSFKARFKQGSVVVDALSFAGGLIHAAVQRVKMVATVYESFFDRVHLHAKNSFRTVEDTETVKAGTIHCLSRKLMTLRARFSIISAKKDVKIDGKHIHMG